MRELKWSFTKCTKINFCIKWFGFIYIYDTKRYCKTISKRYGFIL